MGLLSALLGHASDADIADVQRELEPVLLPDEPVELAFRTVRDLFVFTSHRLILVDKQGLTGRKREITSIPYRAITMMSVESAGHFDLEGEMRIWISGQGEPLTRTLGRGVDAAGIQKALAAGLFGRS
ncbi:PH domain-containing protein [Mangrovicella endophytica]|uniref:PH domain-containing protein n=1 Tax=Mangrovicella endophytica TaxID=2066697 RepID=UPI000C9DAFE7|nr:PH domain-containing protein [Mangrovicella endophytica]